MKHLWMNLKREFNHIIINDRSGTVVTRCGQLLARTDLQCEFRDQPYCLSCKNHADRDSIKREKKLAKKNLTNG